VGAFEIARTETTIAQFRRFVEATGTVTQAEREGGGYVYEAGFVRKPGWTWQRPFGTASHPDWPAVHVNYAEAQAFCTWAGGRLPTDAEWTSAAYLEQRPAPPTGWARGQRYPYPLGATAKGSHCLGPCANLKGTAPNGSLTRGTGHVPVMTTPPGVNGLYDMGGNVWEWVDGGSGNERITRGGSWWYGPERQVADDVATKPRDTRVVYIGFRCVKTNPP
jgi:formylglycine-generating enzyme required for sulfatase activity